MRFPLLLSGSWWLAPAQTARAFEIEYPQVTRAATRRHDPNPGDNFVT